MVAQDKPCRKGVSTGNNGQFRWLGPCMKNVVYATVALSDANNPTFTHIRMHARLLARTHIPTHTRTHTIHTPFAQHSCVLFWIKSCCFGWRYLVDSLLRILHFPEPRSLFAADTRRLALQCMQTLQYDSISFENVKWNTIVSQFSLTYEDMPA